MNLSRTTKIIPALAVLLVQLCCSALALADNESVILLADASKLTVSRTHYLTDPHKTISAEQFFTLFNSGAIQSTADMPFNLGMTTSRYLLGFTIHNHGKKEQTLQLATGASYRPLLQVWLFDMQGRSEMLLKENHATEFNQRNSGFRYLHTRPFKVSQSQYVNLVIEYETIGSSYLPLSLGSVENITQLLHDDALNSAYFYSFCLSALLLFALFGSAMSEKTIILYALLFLLGLLTVASMEGFAFKFLWPGMPVWNHYSPLVLLYLLAAAGAWLAWWATAETGRHKFIRLTMLGLSLLSGLLAAGTFFIDYVRMAELVSLPLIAMFIAHVYTMSTWLTMNNPGNKIALLGASFIAISFITLVLLSLDNQLLPAEFYIQSTRVIYLSVMLATIAALTSHVRTLHKNHQRALLDALDSARREASINLALYESEQNYSRARQLADLRRKQLASASHDIKQPLISLRSTLDTFIHNQPAKTREQLLNAFNYLDNLCVQYLRETRPETDSLLQNDSHQDRLETDIGNSSDLQEPCSINLVLNTAVQMFADEAAQKKIELHCCACSVMTTTSPIILLRLYSNLVSNAVKHTAQGKILLGARRGKNALSLQVLDNGAGMSAQQLSSVMQAYRKGPDSEGSGLGLAICHQLAVEHDLELDIVSREGHGTVCRISIPL